MDKVIIQVRGVPRKLRDQFKALAALRSTTVTAEIIRLIQREVEKERK